MHRFTLLTIISYQAITGNNNREDAPTWWREIISYQAITGNNNQTFQLFIHGIIISYQAITGNNNGIGLHLI